MPRKLLFVAIVGALFGSAAFACTNCLPNGDQEQVNQAITVSIPTVLKLVVDNPNTQDWTVDLSQIDPADPATYPSDCYVIPYWVTNTSELESFLATAGATSGDLAGSALFPWKPGMGYPPVVKNASGKVLLWNQTKASTAYTETGGNEQAKGNLLCSHVFTVEKYTNCDGAVFWVSLGRTDAKQGNPGDMYIYDHAYFAGTTTDVTSRGFTSLANYGDNYLLVSGAKDGSSAVYKGIPPGSWINDDITQYLWLGSSDPGSYGLQATFTLGSAIASNTNGGGPIVFQNP